MDIGLQPPASFLCIPDLTPDVTMDIGLKPPALK